MSKRPDIILLCFGTQSSLRPCSAAADSFLARKFAQVEGDLTQQDINRIVAQAQALGFVVVEG